MQRNKDEDIQASEFEILTATAFDIFTEAEVEVAVVEVGMGGRDDATNILKSKDLAVITRIGLDHQAFLGDTIEEIARHKCGIFRKDVPVLYYADRAVKAVILEEAKNIGAEPVWPVKHDMPDLAFQGTIWKDFSKSIKHRRHQQLAIQLAWRAFRYMYSVLRPDVTTEKRDRKAMDRGRDVIMNMVWPGRMQHLDISRIVPEMKGEAVLLDGAHNVQAAEMLATVVNSELRKPEHDLRICWVIASTKGRPVKDFLEYLLVPGDRVAAVEFGPVDGMPWVEALPSREIASTINEHFSGVEFKSFDRSEPGHIQSALQWASATGAPVVVTGSLYLVGDVLRRVRNAGGAIDTPPPRPERKERPRQRNLRLKREQAKLQKKRRSAARAAEKE